MQGKKNIISTDLCILVIIAVACVYMFCASISLSAEAKLFPQVTAAVTFIFTIYAIGKHIMTARGEAPAAEGGEAAPRKYNHLLLIGIALLYLVLLQPIGFILCTIALFLAIPLVLGNRSYVVLVLVSVIATIAFYLIFKKAFYVNLPAGILPFF